MEKHGREIQKVKFSLQEAINKAMERYGGIPVGANIEAEEEEDDFIICVQLAKPAKGGVPAGLWEAVLDAETGDLAHMEEATEWRERELREQAQDRERRRAEGGKAQDLPVAKGKHPYVAAYIAQIRKIELPIQIAIDTVTEEHGGIPIAAQLEWIDDEEDEGEFVFTVMTVKPAKQARPASIWEIAIDADTGELMRIANAGRWMERELKERERDRERRRKEEEKDRDE